MFEWSVGITMVHLGLDAGYGLNGGPWDDAHVLIDRQRDALQHLQHEQMRPQTGIPHNNIRFYTTPNVNTSPGAFAISSTS